MTRAAETVGLSSSQGKPAIDSYLCRLPWSSPERAGPHHTADTDGRIYTRYRARRLTLIYCQPNTALFVDSRDARWRQKTQAALCAALVAHQPSPESSQQVYWDALNSHGTQKQQSAQLYIYYQKSYSKYSKKYKRNRNLTNTHT